MTTMSEALRYLREMKPGERIDISCHDLLFMNFPRSIFDDRWTAQDWLLERIVGSAYEYGYWLNPFRNSYTFYRLEKPLTDDRHSYISPDKRDLFKQDSDGFWIYKGQ